jgi:multiple sugar transport system permease protein
MQASTIQALAAPRRMSRRRQRHIITGYLYLTPWLLGFLLFWLGPAAASLALSLTSYDVISAPTFIGLKNYTDAFTNDPLFVPSLFKTLYFAGTSVPAGLLLSLGAALLLNQKVRGTSIFRTLFFMPSLLPIVASTVLWAWLLQPDWGLVNGLLYRIGVHGPRWFASTEWAIPGLISLALWTTIGGPRMIIFLAGLQGVPDELYDAAAIDGASRWQRFRHVTLPMITPTIFFNLVLGIIGALQVFTSAYVATAGGPAYATWFYAVNIYYQAFQYFNMGYAAALSWLFAVLIITLTWSQFRMSRSWVYYAGGE